MPPPLKPFALERYFAKYEFNPGIRHLLCCSDTEPLNIAELFKVANPNTQAITNDGDGFTTVQLPSDPETNTALWNEFKNVSLVYTDTCGLPALRQAIADTHYTSVSMDDLFVAAPQELIFLAMLALLEQGDVVVAISPAYQSLHEVARSIGATILPWKARQDPNTLALTFDVADAERLMRDRNVKLVIVNAPHNPTGWLPTHEEWTRVLKACEASGAYLFSDEMYRFLELDPERRLPAAVDALPSRGISLSGLSKAVGMPGLRIGWLAMHDKTVLARIKELRDYTTICGAAPSEQLALVALRSWDRLVEHQMAIIRENLDQLERFSRRWESVLTWTKPVAGSIGFPLCKVGMSSQEFCERLAEEHGVLLLPGEVVNAGAGTTTVESGKIDCGGDRGRSGEDDDATVLEAQNSMSSRCRFGYGRRDFPEGLAALERALLAMGYHPAEQ
jgi:aspartate/methionine/tyrosine aminotransferase